LKSLFLSRRNRIGALCIPFLEYASLAYVISSDHAKTLQYESRICVASRIDGSNDAGIFRARILEGNWNRLKSEFLKIKIEMTHSTYTH